MGSDWIGFQQMQVEFTAGFYRVEVQVKWVKHCKKDYTVGLHSEFPIDLYECISYQDGSKDDCNDKIKGSSFRPGEEAPEPEEGPKNIEEVLELDIAEFYNDIEDLDWLTISNRGWYKFAMGQIHKEGKPTDRFMYDFMDAKGKYNIDVTLAAKCNAKATCFMFPRCYMDTLENKTVEYGYDEDEYTFIVGECRIEPDS